MKGHAIIIGVDLIPTLFPGNEMLKFFIPTSTITEAPKLHLYQPAAGTPHNIPTEHLAEAPREKGEEGPATFIVVEDEENEEKYEEEENEEMDVSDDSITNKTNETREEDVQNAVKRILGETAVEKHCEGPTFLLDRKKLEAFLIKEMSPTVTSGEPMKISRVPVSTSALRKQAYRASH